MAGSKTISDAWAEEEELKEQVYRHLEADLKQMQLDVSSAEAYVRSGAYEDQDAFTAHGNLSSERRKELRLKQAYAAIFSNPYFTHLEIEASDDETLQVMLSDLPELDHQIQIGSSSYILPFRQSAEAPMLSALFEQYSNKRAGSFQVNVRGQVTNYRNNLLRDVSISNRKLENVVQYYPDLTDEAHIDADELLEKRLEENRSDAQLRNIIKTLQSSQFQIIRAPIDESFVVQGCAGSGKTQCLLHRLFFLRAELDDRGWQKVLLITPSQLFRNYSRDLMRRFKLTDVRNTSVSNLYQELLSVFDTRFKNRQYQFELTEEFLPDEYLRQVYDKSEIRKIEGEIERAIASHIQEAQRLLNIPDSPRPIDAKWTAELVRRLETEIEQFDHQENMLSDDSEYQEHRNALERGEKEIAVLARRRETLEESAVRLEQEQSQYERLRMEIELAEGELKSWKEQQAAYLAELRQRHTQTMEKAASQSSFSLSEWDSYRKSLFSMLDAEEAYGNKYRHARETEAYLEEICELSRQDMKEFTGNKTERVWLHRFSERKKNQEEQLQKVTERIYEITAGIELHSDWLRLFAEQYEGVLNYRREYRAGLERARYYLTRLESSVFEQEVWNALAPLKEKCGIRTIHTESTEDGHQRQIRILYKSDLLFYLKIYLRLHTIESLPEYHMICIDEGQDLHSADYQMLRSLFPKASVNVFGDTAQTLHNSCGILDWEADTGIERLYVLHTNYRNTPAIVEFCNQTFGQTMKYIGKSLDKDRPQVCKDYQTLQKAVQDDESVVIVKDRAAFEAFCREIRLEQDEFTFLDTTADMAVDGKRQCYSVFAAKGLEFPHVLVYAKNMTFNQKTVACTRAMQKLYYCDG